MGVFHVFYIVQMVLNRATDQTCNDTVQKKFKPYNQHLREYRFT